MQSVRTSLKVALCAAVIMFGTINLVDYSKEEYFRPLIPNFQPLPNEVGSGTGWYVNEDTIVTDAHVTSGLPTVQVQYLDGSIIEGKVIVEDDKLDLALIRMPKKIQGVTPLCVSNDLLRYGDSLSFAGFGMVYNVAGGVDYQTGKSVGLTDRNTRDQIVGMPGDSGSPILQDHGCVTRNLHAVQAYQGQAIDGIALDTLPGVLKQFLDSNNVAYREHRTIGEYFQSDSYRLLHGIVRIAVIMTPEQQALAATLLG